MARVIRAVAEPEAHCWRSHLGGDLNALEEVIGGLAADLGVRVAYAPEAVIVFLEHVGVYGADPNAEIRGVLCQLRVIVDPVPGDMEGD